MRRTGRLVLAMILAMNVLWGSGAHAVDIAPNAKSAVLIDVVSGRLLYGKNAGQRLPMASTTKIITAITAIEEGNLQDTATASLRAQNIGGSSIYLQAGERLSVEDLLYGLMLQSGNDAAVAVAEHVGGNMEEFVRMMNDKAAEIGAFNSSFVNPHGLDAKYHYTTAKDLAVITAYALGNESFSRIVSTRQKKIPWWSRDHCRVLKNKNRLLWQVQGGDGVKTGYTNNAGRCLVASATRDGWQLVSVVLNCGPMWEESVDLLEYGFNTYQPVTFYDKGQFVKTVAIKNGKKDRVRIVTDRLVRVPLTGDEKERVEIVEEWADFLQAPVKEGQRAGEVRVELDGEVIMKAGLVCQESVNKRGMKASFLEILKAVR